MELIAKNAIEIIKTNELYEQAVITWLNDGDDIINYMNGIRYPIEETNDEFKETIMTLYEILDRSILPLPLTVYHGTNNKSLIKLKHGDYFEISTLTSTSLSNNIAEIFGDIIMKINLPAGTNGFYATGYEIYAFGNDQRSEYEILLFPSRYKFVGIDPLGFYLFDYIEPIK